MRNGRISFLAATAAIMSILAAATPRLARATVVEVFNADFESGLPAQFSAPGCVIEGVQGYAGLGPVGNQFGGNFMRYTAITIMPTKLTIRNLPAHDSVSISFLLAIIDSWDGTELLKISVDGVELFSHWFQLATGDASDYIAPAGGLLSSGTNLGFSNGSWYGRDRAYNMGVEPAFISIPHTADSVVVSWTLSAVSGGAAQHWQGGSDESWGIDNVRVIVNALPTGIGDTPAPRSLTLLPNTPNPFQSTTTLRIGMADGSEAEIEVFDVRGRRVRHLSVPLASGWQDVAFSAVDDRGRALANGVYVYRVRAGGETRTHKMLVAR